MHREELLERLAGLTEEVSPLVTRLDRNVNNCVGMSKDMHTALVKYARNPEGMKPQLQNLKAAAQSAQSSLRVILRTLEKMG